VIAEYKQTYVKKHIALPGEHGAWVFILSPLLIGLFAGGRWNLASAYLVVALMSAFLIRQPVTIAVKAYSGRRSKKDLPATRFWLIVYALFGLAALAGLVMQGFSYLLILALPGVPVFIWHLWLVSRRAERRQVGVEIVGSGVLALAAPAAYWTGVGHTDPAGWWLFALCWLQSAASIVYAYLRLEQRDLRAIPPMRDRLMMATRSLVYATFNLAFTLVASRLHWLPLWIPFPYLLQWAECLYGAIRPAVGLKPTAIGFRQLAVSSLFTILFILTWQ
jgi:hypothetical protein